MSVEQPWTARPPRADVDLTLLVILQNFGPETSAVPPPNNPRATRPDRSEARDPGCVKTLALDERSERHSLILDNMGCACTVFLSKTRHRELLSAGFWLEHVLTQPRPIPDVEIENGGPKDRRETLPRWRCQNASVCFLRRRVITPIPKRPMAKIPMVEGSGILSCAWNVPCLSGCHPYPLHLGCSQFPE